MKLFIYIIFLFSILSATCEPPNEFHQDLINDGLDPKVIGLNKNNVFNPLYGSYVSNEEKIEIYLNFHQVIVWETQADSRKNRSYYNYSRKGNIFTFCPDIAAPTKLPSQEYYQKFLSNFCSENNPVARYRVTADPGAINLQWERIDGLNIFLIGKDKFILRRDIKKTLLDEGIAIMYFDLVKQIAIGHNGRDHQVYLIKKDMKSDGTIDSGKVKINFLSNTHDIFNFKITQCLNTVLNCQVDRNVSYTYQFQRDGTMTWQYQSGKQLWDYNRYSFLSRLVIDVNRNKIMPYYFLNYLYANKRYQGKMNKANKIIEFKSQNNINTKATMIKNNQTYYLDINTSLSGQGRTSLLLVYCKNQNMEDECEYVDVFFTIDATYLGVSFSTQEPWMYFPLPK